MVSRDYERTLKLVYGDDAFARLDEGDDRLFYARDRLVEHMDAVALAVVERLIGTLVVEPHPVILDLMASIDSHLPASVVPQRVVGLGLNARELAANPVLDERIIHDCNHDPLLPFADDTFDTVLNTVSVDYLTRPFDVFREVGRVLRPGGLHLVTFSNRMFPEKVVEVWRRAAEHERVFIVEDYFAVAACFERTHVFVDKGRPRDPLDRHAAVERLADPVYAVWAEKNGGPAERAPRQDAGVTCADELDAARCAQRRRDAVVTRTCPHCGARLAKWVVPQTPFTEWASDHMYICFNDLCPYLARGWNVMSRQGNLGFSYRAMLDPSTGAFTPIPVHSLRDLRDGIVPE